MFQVFTGNHRSRGKACLNPWLHLKIKRWSTVRKKTEQGRTINKTIYCICQHKQLEINLKAQFTGFLCHKASTDHDAGVRCVRGTTYCCKNNTAMLHLSALSMEVEFHNFTLLFPWHCITLEVVFDEQYTTLYVF
jgi:hypothetical protein